MTKPEPLTPRWYCVRAATRQESRAIEALKELKVEAYLPMETRWATVGRTREPKEAPLFQGYLFAKMTDNDFHRVRVADGVHNIVSNQGKPIRVNERLLMWLAYAQSQGMFDWTWSPKPIRWEPKKGDVARVVSGHYTGFVGKITKLKGAGRATVLGELFGRSKPLDLPITELEMIKPEKPTPRKKAA